MSWPPKRRALPGISILKTAVPPWTTYTAALTPVPTARVGRSSWERSAPLAWLLGPWVAGTALGFLQDPQGEPCSSLAPAVARLSAVLGWVYFSAWSVSFYPQVWLNYWRKSVVGLSLDYQILGMVGFVCYSIYNSALFWNSAIRQEYARQHSGAVPAVHSNDVFFAIHAAVLTGISLLQCCIYDRGGQTPSRFGLAGAAATAAAAAALAGAVAAAQACGERCERSPWLRQLTWLDWIYFLSFVKLGSSILKYIPQAVLNYRRKSTVGWNVWNVVLDLEGGALSLAQLLMDSTRDFSPVTGNPVKFWLGLVSMSFDVLFLLQHFVFYREARPYSPAGPASPAGLAGRTCHEDICSSAYAADRAPHGDMYTYFCPSYVNGTSGHLLARVATTGTAGAAGSAAAPAGPPVLQLELGDRSLDSGLDPLVLEPKHSRASPAKQQAIAEGRLLSEAQAPAPSDESAALLPSQGR